MGDANTTFRDHEGTEPYALLILAYVALLAMMAVVCVLVSPFFLFRYAKHAFRFVGYRAAFS